MSPEIVLPDFVVLLATRTPRNAGRLAGGDELLPGPVVQVPPQVGGLVVVLAKPLNDGTGPLPLSAFRLDQLDPQKVRVVIGPAAATVESPSTNVPPAGKANTVAVLVS